MLKFSITFIISYYLIDRGAKLYLKMKKKLTKKEDEKKVTPYRGTPPRVYSKLNKEEQCLYCDRRGVLIICDRADFQGGVLAYCAHESNSQRLIATAHNVVTKAVRDKVTLLCEGQ